MSIVRGQIERATYPAVFFFAMFFLLLQSRNPTLQVLVHGGGIYWLLFLL
jgi:hypothetical protein